MCLSHDTAGAAFVRPLQPGNTKQQWIIVNDCIQNKSETNLVLDVNKKSLLVKTVGEYTYHGGENQLWSFEPVP